MMCRAPSKYKKLKVNIKTFIVEKIGRFNKIPLIKYK